MAIGRLPWSLRVLAFAKSRHYACSESAVINSGCHDVCVFSWYIICRYDRCYISFDRILQYYNNIYIIRYYFWCQVQSSPVLTSTSTSTFIYVIPVTKSSQVKGCLFELLTWCDWSQRLLFFELILISRTEVKKPSYGTVVSCFEFGYGSNCDTVTTTGSLIKIRA